jgi:predicted AlkP superfamily phosphohydrolase/phosphomutase
LQRNVYDKTSILHPNRHCGVENGLPERQGVLPYLQTMMMLYPTDFAFAVFTSSDRVQHVAWHRQDPILDFWRELDRIIGEIYEFAVECGYTHFFVASHHGFCDLDSPAAQHHLRRCGKPDMNHYGVLRLEGTYIATGDDIVANQRLDGVSIPDITPTLLNPYGLPIAGDMDGHLVTSLFRDTREEHRVLTQEAQRGDYEGDKNHSPQDVSEVESRPRGLGYIE